MCLTTPTEKWYHTYHSYHPPPKGRSGTSGASGIKVWPLSQITQPQNQPPTPVRQRHCTGCLYVHRTAAAAPRQSLCCSVGGSRYLSPKAHNESIIRLSAPKRGRKSDQVKDAERKQLYQDSCQRNAIEGDYGTGKRKYGLGLIMTRLYDITLTAISFKFFVKNMERVLRLFVMHSCFFLELFPSSLLLHLPSA